MHRRSFARSALTMLSGMAGRCCAFGKPASPDGRLERAAAVLRAAVESGEVTSAVLHVVQDGVVVSQAFGQATSSDAMFLLGSISKPICVTALMSLLDQGHLSLDDRVQKFLPGFHADGRDAVTIRHLLTHRSGLPDQLANNQELRARHAPLTEFAESAIRTPLQFLPGTRYEYSSMGILLASCVAEKIAGTSILNLVHQSVFVPLGLKQSAQGIGPFRTDEFVPVQTARAAPESGGGDPSAASWDWNSDYWRKLGAPWGGTHMSAPDLAVFFDEFLNRRGVVVKPETAQQMTVNQNPADLTPRGLGFNTGIAAGTRGCSPATFGHTGSTGTLAWADPASATICIVLTSLPGRAVSPHPRELSSEIVSGG